MDAVEAFFAECPGSSAAVEAQIAAFFRHHAPGSRLERPVVCVTSGGTTVPMERNCVRYIDNFSAGTRGAMSTQEFLEAGYAVVFLTRTGSLQPWTLDLPQQDTVALLQEILQGGGDAAGGGGGDAADGGSGDAAGGGGSAAGGSALRVAAQHEAAVAGVLQRVAAVQRQRLLLTVPYTTIFEYLQYLRAVALAAAPYGPDCMFYLAAAVSDFFIPWHSLAVHKIQSADGPLALNLSKVPKMLGALRRTWAPGAFVVSFKLETDETILLSKAAGAVERYGVHAVVANLLHTRKDRVLLVTRQGSGGGGMAMTAAATGREPAEEPGRRGGEAPAADAGRSGSGDGGGGVAVVDVRRPEGEPHIERELVARVVALHEAFRQQQGPH